MTKIEIRNRYTKALIYSYECKGNTLRLTVLKAIENSTDLSYADLPSLDLTGADLTGTNLTRTRDDIWSVLSSSPSEVPALVDAIAAGNVDGSTYTGECACLVGTLANVRGIDFEKFESLKANFDRPAEKFFANIRIGDTPETSLFSRLAHEWCVEWLNNMQAAFGVRA